jgi:hypothetical protein
VRDGIQAAIGSEVTADRDKEGAGDILTANRGTFICWGSAKKSVRATHAQLADRAVRRSSAGASGAHAHKGSSPARDLW